MGGRPTKEYKTKSNEKVLQGLDLLSYFSLDASGAWAEGTGMHLSRGHMHASEDYGKVMVWYLEIDQDL